MRLIGRGIWIALTIILVAAAMLFATTNNQTVAINLWPLEDSVEVRLWMLVLGAFGTGALAGSGLVWLSLLASRLRNMRLSRRLGRAEKQAARASSKLAGSGSEQA